MRCSPSKQSSDSVILICWISFQFRQAHSRPNKQVSMIAAIMISIERYGVSNALTTLMIIFIIQMQANNRRQIAKMRLQNKLNVIFNIFNVKIRNVLKTGFHCIQSSQYIDQRSTQKILTYLENSINEIIHAYQTKRLQRLVFAFNKMTMIKKCQGQIKKPKQQPTSSMTKKQNVQLKKHRDSKKVESKAFQNNMQELLSQHQLLLI